MPIHCRTAKGQPCKTGARLGRDCGRHARNGKPGTGGRPTKLSPEVLTRIENAIRSGAPAQVAAASAGIHRSTFLDWLRQGNVILAEYAWELDAIPDNHPERGLAEFSDIVEKAQADWELAMNAIVTKAAKEGAWQAAMTHLERRRPGQYGRHDRVTHGGDPAAPVVIKSYAPPVEIVEARK